MTQADMLYAVLWTLNQRRQRTVRARVRIVKPQDNELHIATIFYPTTWLCQRITAKAAFQADQGNQTNGYICLKPTIELNEGKGGTKKIQISEWSSNQQTYEDYLPRKINL